MAHVHIIILAALLLSPSSSISVTIPKGELFQNTLRIWNVRYTDRSKSDKREIADRFNEFLESVERTTTTSGRPLTRLNSFSVLNDVEYDTIVGPHLAAFNNTGPDLPEPLMAENMEFVSSRKKRDIPTSYNYWEEELGLTTPKDQIGCGSCWSFPVVGTMEALYKKLTGEHVNFSEKHFIDCTIDGNGCSGGEIVEGYRVMMIRQWLRSTADVPYTGYYEPCLQTVKDDMISGANNALKKCWVQGFVKLPQTEAGVLEGLQLSPVAIGMNVSPDLLTYSGGIFTDSRCVTVPQAHAMLLVGYTETTLRVKASYGPTYGDGGYINYDRGAAEIADCKFWKKAYSLRMTVRREMEYSFCNDGKISTMGDCKTDCIAQDTAEETGWGLAVIPTKKHNQEIYEMVNTEFVELKTDDKFNSFWMGLKCPAQDGVFKWADNFTPVGYHNNTVSTSKFGLYYKEDGSWVTKNSLTYQARGICSRATTCWDISTAVKDGDVTFDRNVLTEGTVATATCQNKGTLSGDSSLTCVAGEWDVELPTCAGGEGPTKCEAPTIEHGTVSPSTDIADGAQYTVSCNEGYEMSGSATMTCSVSDSVASLTEAPTCEEESDAAKCEAPTIEHGTVSPNTDIADGAQYTVSCNEGYEMSGSATMTCSVNDSVASLTEAPTCEEESDAAECEAPTIEHGTISPSTDIADGAQYTVSCNEGYEMSGSATMTCSVSDSVASLTEAPTCEEESDAAECEAPTIEHGTVSPSTDIADGAQYTVSCNEGYEMSGSATMTCSVSDSVASLTEAPTCEEVPACTKPTIEHGTITPDVATIPDGDSYTVSCSEDYKIEGEDVLVCTVADGQGTLTAAPTCEQEECDKAVLTIPNLSITSGSASNYYKGDQVVFDCATDYVLMGNNYMYCLGTRWSSDPPSCKAINTQCPLFTVTNGKLGNFHPYFTEDTVRASCNTGYILEGENPRLCQADGWQNAAPTCTLNDGTLCKTLTAPDDGTLSCDSATMVAYTTCTVSCDENFTPLSPLTDTVCNEQLLWDHQSATNSLAEFAPCIEMIPPKAKQLKNRVKLITDYCRNEEEKSKIADALVILLTENLQIQCLVNNKCEIESSDCILKNGQVKVKFTLSQTQDMLDTTVLKEAKTTIKASVKGKTFVLSVDEARRRRRRSVSLAVDENSLETEDVVTCEEGEAVQNGVCGKCPTGYKTVDAACVACPMGTYNGGEGASSCTDCDGDKTTYGEGSTNADQCYELCTVPTIYGGRVDAEAGFSVERTYSLTLTCDETFEATTASFVCQDYDPQTDKCNALDECAPSLLQINYGSYSGGAAPFESGESVTFACDSDYTLVGNKVLQCNSRVWSNFAPHCQPINDQCTSFEIENGQLNEASPYFTGEIVTVDCMYGYEAVGTNPRVCDESGWATDAPTCTKIAGDCMSLTAPLNGQLSCSDSDMSIGTTCIVSCDAGYTTTGDITEVMCMQEGLLWDHQLYDNSRGSFEPCSLVEDAMSRMVSAELYVDLVYCSTEEEKEKVTSALEEYVDIECIQEGECEIQNVVCTKEETMIKLTFDLVQTSDLADPDKSIDSDAYLKNMVTTGVFSFDVEDVTFTAYTSSYASSVETTCVEGSSLVNDNYCITCPAGYKSSPSCTACPVGSYSLAAESTNCETCADDLTTYGKGSSSSESCMDLCKVPGIIRGSTNPPTGFIVDKSIEVTLTCDIGYIPENNLAAFTCDIAGAKCIEDTSTSEVSGGKNSTTIIIIVVVVVTVIVIGGVAVVLYAKYRHGLKVGTENEDKPDSSTAMVDVKQPSLFSSLFKKPQLLEPAEPNIYASAEL